METAPPRYPVGKVAPRIEVRGITWRMVHASRVMPMATVRFSKRPNRTPAASTEAFITLVTPSKSRSNTTSAVRMRPDHGAPVEKHSCSADGAACEDMGTLEPTRSPSGFDRYPDFHSAHSGAR